MTRQAGASTYRYCDLRGGLPMSGGISLHPRSPLNALLVLLRGDVSGITTLGHDSSLVDRTDLFLKIYWPYHLRLCL